MNYCDDDWLAGFADGEGSFQINSGNGFNPGFEIQLTAEDASVLEELHRNFGGHIGHKGQYRNAKSGSISKPTAYWKVRDKVGLLRLVDYFDAHPLRSKKASDYAIWRRAVIAYAEEGGGSPEIRRCQAEIDAIRYPQTQEELTLGQKLGLF